ncbi:FAS1-like dehydratase domain-containing protein [Arvimicrobium flavum]|uniref:FAS1-like dehydratase domain-containing protein n=1 Tax=Arvimicrobium flavum TaxID=3393320 RepID=UPI00237B6C72|nr:MaoC family dehydratase N-terminal domain-containing protein [Mesorhizobium shangrilense]
MTDFADWIGRRSESEDIVTGRLVDSFRAIFEPHLAPPPPGVAPPGIHWCLAPAIVAMAELGQDGHPARNRDLPPVPQPRRMWAGGRVEHIDPLRIGDRVRCASTIAGIARKQGRSGELWFVAVDRDYLTERGPAVRERHDIVYLEAPKGRAEGKGTAGEAPQRRRVDRSWTVLTSSTLLFRYSAISFNGHRIHYDFPYAVNVEGHDGLVVHAPIQATLLLNLACRDGTPPPHFTYRGVSPAIAGNDLMVCADDEHGSFWIEGPTGRVSMIASATRQPG